MERRAARALHLALFLTGVVLYVVFILPRWWVLTGDIPSTLATVGRITAGIPMAAAALPVMQILQAGLRRKPPTPEIALRLRAWSAVLHVVAGVLILLAAIAEIWLSLEAGGPWLFGVYGAAGAIAILAFAALYLSFVAEQPPAGPKPPKAAKPPKPAKVKVQSEKKPRGKKAKSAAPATAAPATSPAVTEETSETADEAVTADTTETVTDTDETPESDAAVIEPAADPVEESPAPATALRNKRPSGKNSRRLGRSQP